ncbi:DUF732 domain-containing protein [Mycolicibacterium sp. BiH015]|uniref:DUF732 domain-containing protein n=1 Tax=Mycolicibacterium sp. BiH015 TaxID=3018808 RepID=UPI0022E86012|nr:DUF732 domain-containing protein [Mycolicibacterium sp. BiH015]MDA2895408.1 DUF732 domain-containing protein [Mycolicibacterium sp. BiH015]
MIRRRRTVAVAMVAAGLAMFGGAATANAQTPDEQFAKAITQLGIPHSPEEDLSLVGHKVCDMLATALTGNPNPVPAVRGVVQTLESNADITKQQAVGVMQASTYIYCPQWARLVGR